MTEVYAVMKEPDAVYTILCRAVGYPPTEFPNVQLQEDRLIDFDMVLEAVQVPQPA